jgi:LPS-assembly protein
VSLKKTPNLCLPARLATRLGPLALAAALCGLYPPMETWAQQAPLSLQDSGGETSVVADRIQQIGGDSNLLLATGNVEITRGGSRLIADRVELNRTTGEAVAQGKVVFFDGQDRLVAERVDYNLNTGTGVVYKGSARIPPYYHLSAERFDRMGESVYGVRQGVFTTCEGDVPAWSVHLGSGQADLDGIIFGRDASFWVKSVPVIPWIPFFAAALRRERQSGFLFPEFGQNSRKGYFARVPYYWAISDSQDLTIALDTYTKRGMGLELDYRYILSRETQGQITAFGVNESFLDSRSSKGLDENRGWIQIKHGWQITPSTSLKIDSSVTSDDEIYKTYAYTTSERVRQRAETNVFLTKRWESWNLVGRIYWYQDLTTPRPVELQRAPEIKLEGIRQAVPGIPGLLYETQASFVNFHREIGSEGVRGDFHPRFLYPIPVQGLFTMTPFFGGRLTYYNQRVVSTATSLGPSNESAPQTVEKTVADDRVRQQVEAGVQLETSASRIFDVGGRGGIAALQHIVEPRATFLEIRGVNQKDNPQFEPGGGPMSRFDPGYEARTGIDAIGKAHEVTYTLINRLNARTVSGPNEEPVRWELARLTLSQTYNFLTVSEPFKDAVGEILIQPNEHLRFRADARYNVYGLGFRDANADISAIFRDFSVTIGPRFNEQQGFRFLQADATARLTRYVNAKASSNWDVTTGRAIEARGGLDIHFDCWAIGVEVIHRYASDDEIRFSVNLLGLGQVGTSGRTGTR